VIEYLRHYDPIEVRADGLDAIPMKKNDTFSISRSKNTFKLVNLHRHEYFATLRSKLNWSGKLR
jgi:NAD+ kinase